ncbi:hypothetical protein CR513_31240, partial [Mucuna pruriens]
MLGVRRKHRTVTLENPHLQGYHNHNFGRKSGRFPCEFRWRNERGRGKEKSQKSSKEPTPTISFDDRDMRGWDEPMVISVAVPEYKVERVLIDQGSSANILYRSTVEKMQLSAGLMQKCLGSLYGFAGECIPFLGTIELETSFGEQSASRTIPILYMVVDAPASYNIIVGRLALNRLGAVEKYAPTDEVNALDLDLNPRSHFE